MSSLNEDNPYRHPGGRTCGGMVGTFLLAMSLLAALVRRASR